MGYQEQENPSTSFNLDIKIVIFIFLKNTHDTW